MKLAPRCEQAAGLIPTEAASGRRISFGAPFRDLLREDLREDVSFPIQSSPLVELHGVRNLAQATNVSCGNSHRSIPHPVRGSLAGVRHGRSDDLLMDVREAGVSLVALPGSQRSRSIEVVSKRRRLEPQEVT